MDFLTSKVLHIIDMYKLSVPYKE